MGADPSALPVPPDPPPIKPETPKPSVPSETQPAAPLAASTLFATPQDALKGVRDDFFYWTGKLTDSSFALSLAVIGANWAVFGSIDRVVQSGWSQWSIGTVIFGLGASLIGNRVMGELHRNRIDYAESDSARWRQEFSDTAGCRNPWPYTTSIERLAAGLREAKTWLPVAGGLLFLAALVFAKSPSPSVPQPIPPPSAAISTPPLLPKTPAAANPIP